MSRIIVKNLPKNIKAKKLENLFSSRGTIADLQLKYTKDGAFRQFAFVGYKTEEEARDAKEYFDGTFVNTSRIQVDICADLSDPNKPQSWKQKINLAKAAKQEAKEKQQEKEKVKKEKKKIEEDIPEELLKDSQFKEFLEINKDRKSKPVWAEDLVDLPDAGSDEDAASSSDSDYESNFGKIEKLEDTESLPTTPTKKSSNISKKEVINDEKSTDKSPVKKEAKTFDDSFTVKVRNLPFMCKKKQIKQFFHPLKIASLRLPPKSKGFAYVKFKTERDMKKGLIKHKSFLEGRQVDVIKYLKKTIDEPKFKNGHQVGDDKEKNEELLGETGRIYVRNLCYTVTENEIEQIFNKFGPLAEVHLPIDFLTKKAQGFAFVTFVFAEHAVKAFAELDGKSFQGRVLLLIPANAKKEYQIDENETDFKKKKEVKLKQMSGSSHNWNILFLGMNAVADVIAEKYSVEKSKLLSGDSKESVAVRMALAETEMVMDNRKFLIQNGVQLDAFSQPAAERSKTVIVAKNLPANTSKEELNELFCKFGTLSRVILPPSGLVALIEFEGPAEARNAFKRLAYSRFHSRPLYLEWAPVDGVKPPLVEENTDTVEESTEITPNEDEETKISDNIEMNKSDETTQVDTDEPPPGTTVFVRNLNFDTKQEDFQKHFKKCGPIHYAVISTKKDVKKGKVLSMGFGFVQFKNKESAVKAIQNLQQSQLDGHALDLKFANRDVKPVSMTQRKKYDVKKQLSAKILVRNIPFEASEKEIKELFKQFGMLKSARLPKKQDGSGEHRGFGFVEYFTKDNAERAFNALCHSTHFFGRRLVLEWANPDSEDVEELRKKTAKTYVDTELKKNSKKRKLEDDVALAADKFGPDDN